MRHPVWFVIALATACGGSKDQANVPTTGTSTGGTSPAGSSPASSSVAEAKEARVTEAQMHLSGIAKGAKAYYEAQGSAGSAAGSGSGSAADWAALDFQYSAGTTPEATLQLNQIAKSARAHYAKAKAFPVGTSKQLPESACCTGAGKACAATAAWATDAIWKDLGVQIDTPTHFQYQYIGKADGATVTAIGDLDCDGKSVTYRLQLSAPQGTAKAEITEPPAGSD